MSNDMPQDCNFEFRRYQRVLCPCVRYLVSIAVLTQALLGIVVRNVVQSAVQRYDYAFDSVGCTPLIQSPILNGVKEHMQKHYFFLFKASWCTKIKHFLED